MTTTTGIVTQTGRSACNNKRAPKTEQWKTTERNKQKGDPLSSLFFFERVGPTRRIKLKAFLPWRLQNDILKEYIARGT